MINGTFKYPEIRFFGYLPKRIPEPSETRFSDNSVTYGCNVVNHHLSDAPLHHRTGYATTRLRV